MKTLRTLLIAAAALLSTSCTLTGKATWESLSVDELAARVPAYDDSTPLNNKALPDVKTIGDLRAALAKGLDLNGRMRMPWGGSLWYMEGFTPYKLEESIGEAELMKRRLACLDVLLKAGGDPQKARACGRPEERAIAYALLIRHGLHADEPFARTPESVAKYGYESETYPLNSSALDALPESILMWLLENGAPVNERFNGKTMLMDLYDGLWFHVLDEASPLSGDDEDGAKRRSEEAWAKAYRVTEILLAHGVDLSLRDTLEDGYCAIDYIPLLGKGEPEEHADMYSADCHRQAQKLEQLLLAHGSPARRASMFAGAELKAFYRRGGTILWDDAYLEQRARESAARAKEEHRAREARLKPLRAKRRAAEAGKQRSKALRQ